MASRKSLTFGFKSVHPYKSSPVVDTRMRNVANEQQQTPKLASQAMCEKVGNKTPEAVTTPKKMATTSSYFATTATDENEQHTVAADDEVQNVMKECVVDKIAHFHEFEAAMEEDNALEQPKFLDSETLDNEFVNIIGQLEEKRGQDKLLMDQLSSFLRAKTEEIIASLEKAFQDMHKTTNQKIQSLGEEFYEELDRTRRLEAKMVEIEHRVRSVFENLQSLLPRCKMASAD